MRNKANVLIGAPDVKAAGGFSIGKPVADHSKWPTDATSPLHDDFEAEPGGYINEDGLTKTVDRTTEKIKDWNGDVVIIVQTEHSVVHKFICMEAGNPRVLKMIYGDDNVTIDDTAKTVTVVDTGDELPTVALDFLMNGGKGKKIRVFDPEAQVLSVGDVQYVRTGVIQYEVEVEALDILGDSRKSYEIRQDVGDAAAPEPDPAG